MKKNKRNGLRSEYRRKDLGRGTRGKYLKTYRAGTNLMLIKPEVAAVFETEKAVNDALRSLIDIAQRATSLTRRSIRRPKTIQT